MKANETKHSDKMINEFDSVRLNVLTFNDDVCSKSWLSNIYSKTTKTVVYIAGDDQQRIKKPNPTSPEY